MAEYYFNTCGASASGGGLPKLAPDLTWPASRATATVAYSQVTIDPSGGLTTAFSLSGKWSLSAINLSGLLTQAYSVELTVDGVLIWNDSFTITSGATSGLLGCSNQITSPLSDVSISCESSILFRMSSTSDTSVTVQYSARPIL